MQSNSPDTKDFFLENGYVVLNLEDTTAISKAQHLSKQTIGMDENQTLEAYHEFINEKDHINNQASLLDVLQKNNIYETIVMDNLSQFQHILGSDILIQNIPHYRIARPHKSDDNVGYHRDTWYGSTAYEVSVIIPLTPMKNGSGLNIIPKSHLKCESTYDWDQVQSQDVKKGNLKHYLGFPYMPKTLQKKHEHELVEVAIVPGQALLISLSLIHGQKINASHDTRFSTDFRLVSGAAPIDFYRIAKGQPYYRYLIHAPANHVGIRYQENQKDDFHQAKESY